MANQFYFIRFLKYIKKKGFIKTIGHIFFIIRRNYLQTKRILFYADLDKITGKDINLPQGYSIELKKRMIDVSLEDLDEFIEHLSIGGMIKAKLEKRFKQGAWLWCIIYDLKLVGFVWTINKKPIKPYYFPLMDKDVHIFDNEIFTEYRGRGINTILLDSVLFHLKKSGFSRAFIETGTWNKPERHSLSKTFFKEIAVVRNYQLFNRIYTIWYKMNNMHN